MTTPSVSLTPTTVTVVPVTKRSVSWSNLAIGAGVTLFEVTTLSQPFEVLKTHLAANRNDSLMTAVKKTWQRGGFTGFYQGLIPWAWIEASTKGAALLFTASEVEYYMKSWGFSPGSAGIAGGMAGGLAQAYFTMGFCTFMKTVEITRQKEAGPSQSTWKVAGDVIRKEGIRGINKGVNAVALRQCTNWGSRLGLSRIAEGLIFKFRKNTDSMAPLSNIEKIGASAVAGALSCWNQPIEVIRVEMQSQIKSEGRPQKLTISSAAKYIYQSHGLKGFYRGVTPRIGLGIWQTVCLVFGGDKVKSWVAQRQALKS
ncbi:mitochondrial carrier [Basidiobolus meristosporus CBS 931.73]|uniref:Mitochondrial carrier n=1 Tax=Basidiobolus meristosporus CBS 931.73 TaxID=1314790 RepID=A0A1Y1Y6Q6_9FUNG|nr:mitochondrial carrier [Basidiobolus meristosporus CBS 931.73]|eukprot:ORX93649.1 mitochondrial carrier [Basidiobolus meristosporus CBS 931.73]